MKKYILAFFPVVIPFLSGACSHQVSQPVTTSMRIMSSVQTPKQESELPTVGVESLKSLSRIIFVSGYESYKNEKFWKAIREAKPELVVIVGGWNDFRNFKVKTATAAFSRLEQDENYVLLRSEIPFLAIWSDTDYGIKDGDGSFAYKEQAKKDFVSYWKYISKYQTTQPGLEHAVLAGSGKDRVQLILLDNYFYSTEWLLSEDSSLQKNWDPHSTLLGKSQWKWLKQELKKEAGFRIFISPMQLGSKSGTQSRWALYPHDRQKFFDLLRATGTHNYLVVSNSSNGSGKNNSRSPASVHKVKLKKHAPLYDVSASFTLLELDPSMAKVELFSGAGELLERIQIPRRAP